MKKILLLELVAFGLGSCHKNMIEPEKEEISGVENFDYVWNTIDQKYSFFTDKNIDWDAIGTEYRQKARTARNTLELFDVIADMLFELEDGHVNLSAGFDISRNWEWYLNYPQNFNYTVLERNYWVQDYQISGPFHSAIIDSVGYIYYESFSDEINESLLDYLILKFNDRRYNSQGIVCKGIIIDVRNNGGGLVSGAELFAGRFADKKTLVSTRLYKNGPGHDDFSKPHNEYIEPVGDDRYTKPVVVLTNRSCYSATNFFANSMKLLPNVTLIGDSTGGGGGLPINDEMPLGWRFRFSTTKSFDPEGNNLEFGVAPDIFVNMDAEDEKNGIDTILETAITFIKNQ